VCTPCVFVWLRVLDDNVIDCMTIMLCVCGEIADLYMVCC